MQIDLLKVFKLLTIIKSIKNLQEYGIFIFYCRKGGKTE